MSADYDTKSTWLLGRCNRNTQIPYSSKGVQTNLKYTLVKVEAEFYVLYLC